MSHVEHSNDRGIDFYTRSDGYRLRWTKPIVVDGEQHEMVDLPTKEELDQLSQLHQQHTDEALAALLQDSLEP